VNFNLVALRHLWIRLYISDDPDPSPGHVDGRDRSLGEVDLGFSDKRIYYWENYRADFVQDYDLLPDIHYGNYYYYGIITDRI
jgi:hypothetical protein